ncbi:hypothetical protein GQX74_007227 [Glossina fuscipes]|nr:hypothetical protein GQX74_007227 [Glossina fuscipes]
MMAALMATRKRELSRSTLPRKYLTTVVPDKDLRSSILVADLMAVRQSELRQFLSFFMHIRLPPFLLLLLLSCTYYPKIKCNDKEMRKHSCIYSHIHHWRRHHLISTHIKL